MSRSANAALTRYCKFSLLPLI